MSQIEKYARNQKDSYRGLTKTFSSAVDAVSPIFLQIEAETPAFVERIVQEYKNYNQGLPDRVLDFGCGVGRIARAFSSTAKVDCCDIDEGMLKHCAKYLGDESVGLYLSDGFSCGDAPSDAYDIVYSSLCMQHIPMRQTRIKILEDMARVLKDGGMVFIQLRYYPNLTDRQIPKNHSAWSENRVAKQTNSACDVWVTQDSLGQVSSDFRLFFDHINLREMESGFDIYADVSDLAAYEHAANWLYVSGIKNGSVQKGLY